MPSVQRANALASLENIIKHCLKGPGF